MAAAIQLGVATALAVALVVALWRFLAIADRLPGGPKPYLYMPLAMGGALLLAIWRMVAAWRQLRRSRRDGSGRPPS